MSFSQWFALPAAETDPATSAPAAVAEAGPRSGSTARIVSKWEDTVDKDDGVDSFTTRIRRYKAHVGHENVAAAPTRAATLPGTHHGQAHDSRDKSISHRRLGEAYQQRGCETLHHNVDEDEHKATHTTNPKPTECYISANIGQYHQQAADATGHSLRQEAAGEQRSRCRRRREQAPGAQLDELHDKLEDVRARGNSGQDEKEYVGRDSIIRASKAPPDLYTHLESRFSYREGANGERTVAKWLGHQ